MQGTRDRVKLGVIGTGLAARDLHLPVLKSLSEYFEIVAVCNRTEPKAIAFAELAGLDHYYVDYRKMLQEAAIDAVLVAVPIEFNYPVSEECAKAGKHILCEKPVAVDLEQARGMIEIPARYGVKLQIAEQFYYRDDIQYARTVMHRGRIGTPFLIQVDVKVRVDPNTGYGATPWRQKPAHRGGFVTDAGVHHMALLRMLGGEVDAVHAFASRQSDTFGGKDTICMNLRFSSGAIGSYSASYTARVAKKHSTRAVVLGTNGALEIGYGEIDIFENDVKQKTHTVSFDPFDGGLKKQWLGFYGAIHANQAIVATAEQTFRDLQILLCALRSSERGKTVTIPVDIL